MKILKLLSKIKHLGGFVTRWGGRATPLVLAALSEEPISTVIDELDKIYESIQNYPDRNTAGKVLGGLG